MDSGHDVVQVAVNLVCGPADVLCILGHFETGSGYAACVDSLAGSEEHAVVLHPVDSVGLAAHVGDFEHSPAAVLLELLGVGLAELVLECGGECDVYGNAPALLAGSEHGLAGELGSHILNLVAVGGTHDEHVVDHFVGDAVLDFANAVGTADGHDLGTELLCLLGSAPCNVTEAGEGDLLAFEALADLLEGKVCEIECTVAGSLGTKDGAAPGHALAGENAGVVLTGELAVHTVEEADFAAADTYVAGGNVLIGTDAAPELEHEGLAEAHDFVVALSNGIEVGTALAATHRESGESVLEGLLEAEELEHGRRNGLVEAETSLIGADSAVELNAISQVGLDFALIIYPGHAEGVDALGFHHALNNLCLLELGMLIVNFFDAFEHFLHCLKILAFSRMLYLELCHDFACFHNVNLLSG